MRSNRLMLVAALAATTCLTTHATIVVNSLADAETPAAGEVTLRSALADANDGEPIVFDASLNGETIALSIVGETNALLVGEVMDITNAPSGPISFLVDYRERDYGRTALYAAKNVEIDASALSNGVTFAWTGGDTDPARVLSVLGDLTLKNVTITGGRSVAVALPDSTEEYAQLATRARGGGLAVWGIATLEDCVLHDNTCYMNPFTPARDRDSGVFGGGIYADIVRISDSVISGNAVTAIGVSGGGVFSVGGAHSSATESLVERSSITGNRITGIFAYGAGAYSDGGGIGKANSLNLRHCTIADNMVAIYPLSFLYGSGYWRGGGVYISNGYLEMRNCTVVKNEVYGVPRELDLDKANLAGGVAATIGNAHAVEAMTICQCVIAGNTVSELGGDTYNEDIYTGSLLNFNSEGHNRFGTLNFKQILAPIGEWEWASLCRKHYPEDGDEDGVALANVIDLAHGATYSDLVLSVGVDAGNPVALSYAPWLGAIDQAPITTYHPSRLQMQFDQLTPDTNNFPAIMLGRLEDLYGLTNFAATFTADFEAYLASVDTDDETEGDQPYTDPYDEPILTLADAYWFGPIETWPSKTYNYPYIEFWHRLDDALETAAIPGMGPELLNDAAWDALFSAGPLNENPDISIEKWRPISNVAPETLDQMGAIRPVNGLSDIGAIEYQPSPTPLLRVNGVQAANNELVLLWNSVDGESYTLWGADNLASNDWTIVDDGIASEPPFNTHTTAAPESARFFKIKAD